MFNNGKITFVGSALVKIARQGTVVNAKGKHIYPGFIAVNASLGLAEVDAVKASVDTDEIGLMLPHIRSLIAYNAESKVVESMRPNGVLMAQITPRGGVISGTSSIMQLDAWNWEDAVVRADEGIHMNWPKNRVNNNVNNELDIEKVKSKVKHTQNLKDFFDRSRANSGLTNSMNLKSRAMKSVFDGSTTVYLNADDEKVYS